MTTRTGIPHAALGTMAGTLAVIAAAAGLLVSPILPAEQQLPAARSTFNIPAQPMRDALTALGKQTGLQVIYPANEVTAGLTAPKIEGTLTAQAALTLLLQNSGLYYEFLNERTVAIRASKPPVSEAIRKMTDAVAGMDAAVMQLAAVDMGDLADAAKSTAKKTKASDDVEEMIVQESKIKAFQNANADIPRTINDQQPYYIFDKKVIETSGAINVEDFLKQRLTMNTVSRNFARQPDASGSIDGNTSISAFNLRGVGAGSTLVLVNGRRLASVANTDSGPGDVNGIPMSAVERIEVLPSSASGIYGGSAVGGVINIILKKDFTGGEVRATYDNTFDTDAPNRTLSASYGMGLGKTRLMLTAQWSDGSNLVIQDRRELFDRGLAAVLRNSPSFIYSSTNPFLGALPNITSTSERINNVTIPDPGTLIFKDGTALGSRSTYISAGISPNTSVATLKTELARNAGLLNLDLPPTSQVPYGLYRQLGIAPLTKSFMASASREIFPNLTVSLDWMRTVNNSKFTAPQNLPSSVSIASSNPFNPFTSAVLVRLPHTVKRPLTTSAPTDTLTFGLSLSLPNGWTGQADYTWSRNTSVSDFSLMDSAFGRDVAAGLVNPFVDLIAYPLALDQYVALGIYNYKSLMRDISIRGSGPLPSLPWGTPNLTFGLEHRMSARLGGVRDLLYPITPTSTSRTIYLPRRDAVDSIYVESSIPLVSQGALPLLRSLDLQLANRIERLDVGTGTSSYTITMATGAISYSAPTLNGQPYFSRASYMSSDKTFGLKYQPLSGLTVRTSIATAFLPPSPSQLIKNPIPNPSPTAIADPKKNNATVQVVTISGGNPDLKPQNSEGWNAGVIWEPIGNALSGLRVNLEYYRIQQFDAIGSLTPQQLVTDEVLFQDRVIRDASGNIVLVDTSSLNLFKRDTSGWDLSVDYRKQTPVGYVSVGLVGSTILGLATQYALTSPMNDTIGSPAEGGAAKYKSNATLNWERDHWNAGWTVRYFGSYKQYGAAGGSLSQRYSNGAVYSTTYIDAQGGDTIPAQLYHDVFLSYSSGGRAGEGATRISRMLSGMTVQMGVRNIFNKLPPFDPYYDFYASPYADLRLRSYWLSVRSQF